MLKRLLIVLAVVASGAFAASVGDVSAVKTLKVERGLTEAGKSCVECHAKLTPGHVNDWKESRHGHVGVSCIDCHSVAKDNPMAAQNCDGVKGTDIYVSVLVSPKTCSRCHPNEVAEFQKSGHARGALQVRSKAGMQALMHKFEGRNHP